VTLRGGTAEQAVALVAAHDEERVIAQTVKALRDVEGITEVVVVADGCTDGTAAEAAGAGARVLSTPGRLGKGTALEGAIERVPPAPMYVLVDGDVGATASQVDALLEEVRSGRADVAIGRLPAQAGGGFGMVKALAATLIRRLGGFESEAPLSGQRALTREALSACRPLAPGFGLETAMTIDATRMGFRVVEVPVSMRHRATGRTIRGFTHRGRQGLDVVRAAIPRALGVR